jgi:hypothetical protein
MPHRFAFVVRLIVISIIAMLVKLLLRATQAARGYLCNRRADVGRKKRKRPKMVD